MAKAASCLRVFPISLPRLHVAMGLFGMDAKWLISPQGEEFFGIDFDDGSLIIAVIGSADAHEDLPVGCRNLEYCQPTITIVGIYAVESLTLHVLYSRAYLFTHDVCQCVLIRHSPDTAPEPEPELAQAASMPSPILARAEQD